MSACTNIQRNRIRLKSNFRVRVRRSSGSVLVLAMVVIGLLAVSLLIGYSYGGLFFEHNRLQASANEMALAAARKLNDKDRIGQMNNMIARNRQLVFSGRQQFDECKEKVPGLASLAEELLDESRDSAKTLEAQRKQLSIVAKKEAKLAMQKKFEEINKTYAMYLPWMKVEEPLLAGWQCGRVVNTESNVEMLKNISELEAYDIEQSYATTAGMKLYKHDIDAKLPNADSDLNFRIAALSAPVMKTVAPARIILDANYDSVVGDNLPSACRVKVWLPVGTGLGPNASSKMSCIGAASATGGSTQQ
jgi:hypothetical protein